MQCDVTTIVCQADLADKGRQTETGNPNESSEMLSNYRLGTTASARVLYKRLQIGKIISGAVGKYTNLRSRGRS